MNVNWQLLLVLRVNVTVENALEVVQGYTIANDVSARDWQTKNGNQVLIGKSFDTFCPLGPRLVPRELVPNVQNLGITTKINGIIEQNGNTKDMIFSVAEII